MNKKKMWQFIAIFCVELLLFMPFYFVDALTIFHTAADISVGPDYAQINWTTDIAATGRLEYGTNQTDLDQSVDDALNVTNHSLDITGLTDETLYYYKIIAFNGSMNVTAEASFTTLDITGPPKVTNFTNISITFDQIILGWDASNATDLSHYMFYKNGTNIINLTDLTYQDDDIIEDTEYKYGIAAVDTTGNIGELSEITVRSGNFIAFSLYNVQHSIRNVQVVISWLTSEITDSRLDYGTSMSLGQTNYSGVNTTFHSMTLLLDSDTTYFYQVTSCDRRDCVNSSVANFTTGNFTPLFLNITLPRLINTPNVDIRGNTSPYTSIFAYHGINPDPDRSAEADVRGNFNIVDFRLDENQENIIRLELIDLYRATLSRTFTVFSDTILPKLNVTPLPKATFDSSIEINGTVDEPALIEIFYESPDTTPPGEVKDLEASDIQQNSVTLQWTAPDDTDILDFIVYRVNASPIGLVTSTTYQDTTPNSGRTYIYSVAARDVSGNIGPQISIAVDTLANGTVNNTTPAEPDLSMPPVAVINLSRDAEYIAAGGAFRATVSLLEGLNTFTVFATDRAGNRVSAIVSTVYDAEPPTVVILDPKDGTFMYDISAKKVDIKGNASEPGQKAYLFVNCDFYQYDTTIKSNGNFEFDDVDLMDPDFGITTTGNLSIAGTNRSYHASGGFIGFTDCQPDTDPNKRIDVFVFDAAGRNASATAHYRIGSCFGGNFTYEVDVLEQYNRPWPLSVDRLQAGTEQIWFYVNLTFVGYGVGDHVSSVTFKSMTDDQLLQREERYNLSFQIMPAGPTIATPVTPDQKLWYLSYRLRALQNITQFYNMGSNAARAALGTEISFPFQVVINYQYKESNFTDITISGTQTSCDEAAYPIDTTMLNMSNILPDWLLYDAVEWLNYTISQLTRAVEILRMIIERWLIWACIFSFLGRLVWMILRKISCHYGLRLSSSSFSNLAPVDSGTTPNLICPDQDDDKCKDEKFDSVCFYDRYNKRVRQNGAYESIVPTQALGSGGNLPQGLTIPRLLNEKFITDYEMKKCFPTCGGMWETEQFLYRTYRLFCDRMFCASTPSRWTEGMSDSKITDAIDTSNRNKCSQDDGSVQGNNLERIDNCKEEVNKPNSGLQWAPVYSDQAHQINGVCFSYTYEGTRALYIYKTVQDRYTIMQPVTTPSSVDPLYTVKEGDNYLAALPVSCQTRCEELGLNSWGCRSQVTCVDRARSGRGTRGILLAKCEDDDRLRGDGGLNPDTNAPWGCGKTGGYTISEARGGDIGGAAQTECFKPATSGQPSSQTVQCCCWKETGDTTPTPSQYYPYYDLDTDKIEGDPGTPG